MTHYTGITYEIGDNVHVMPFDEYDTEHDIRSGEDCPCGPDKSVRWPFSNSATPAPPQNVYHHKPVKDV